MTPSTPSVPRMGTAQADDHPGPAGRVGQVERRALGPQVVDDDVAARRRRPRPTGPPDRPGRHRGRSRRAAGRAGRPPRAARARPSRRRRPRRAGARRPAAGRARWRSPRRSGAATPTAPPRTAGRRGCAGGAAACGPSSRSARPAIRSTTSSGWTSSGDTSATSRPWRSTRMRSARSKTCSMRCDTRSRRHPRAPQAAEQPVDEPGLLHPERGGRLVEQQEPGPVEHGPGDGDELALPARQQSRPGGRGRACRCRGSEQQPAPRRTCRLRTAGPTAAPGPRKRLATASRLSHRARSCHTTETPRACTPAAVPSSGRPSSVTSPASGLSDAGQAGDQRRLAGAVPADQRHELARAEVEVDVVEHDGRPEPAGQPPGLQARRRSGTVEHAIPQIKHGTSVTLSSP